MSHVNQSQFHPPDILNYMEIILTVNGTSKLQETTWYVLLEGSVFRTFGISIMQLLYKFYSDQGRVE